MRVVLRRGPRPRAAALPAEAVGGGGSARSSKRGVEVRTGAQGHRRSTRRGVTVTAADGASERIAARTVLWAAGVAASPLAKTLGAPLDRAGRVEVEPDLTIPGHPEVFVIGDLAHRSAGRRRCPRRRAGRDAGRRHAAAIIRAGRRAARPRPPFRYKDKGSLATIGRASAVVDVGRVELSGFFAWLFWWAIHILLLISFRNRVFVFLQWIWSWVTFQRGARLITGKIPALPAVRDVKADGTLAIPPAVEVVSLASGEER